MVWAIVGIYLTGYLYSFRRIAGQLAWYRCANPLGYKRNGEYPDGEQWAFGLGLGALFCLVWPLALPIAYGISTQSGKIFYIPNDAKQRILKKRIEQLEREAGIR